RRVHRRTGPVAEHERGGVRVGGIPQQLDHVPRVRGIVVIMLELLPATGQTLNLWIPIIGGVLLLGGAAAIIVNVLRRRRLR
ncbi:MAG TPA: hypothetical protein PLS63_14495, partial [Microthrixaceae bacterium]|nr:hypothetical protein [Microthrixaceae bacterium]